MKNSLRKALKTQALTLGSWLSFGHTATAELMAQAGFDWLTIDLEHSVIGIDTVQPMIQVIELTGCVPLVRLPSHDPVMAKRVMDAGAHGVIVPNIMSPDEAEAAVRSVKYPPRGNRGVGLARAQGYGSSFQEYLRELEEYGIVIVMIEHKEGVESVEEILKVEGIDGIFIGPYDLSASFGVPGELDHPLMAQAEQQLVDACRKAGVTAGIHVVHPDPGKVRECLARGFRFIAYGGDMIFLTSQARQALADLNSLRQSATGQVS